MITRTLRGMGALAVVAVGLLGWPAALLAIGNGVAPWLPDLVDPLALLGRPDTGGLFLAIALALAWAAWVVWSIALVVEASAQVRGVPTPRLGGLFPQGAAAALVTAVAVAFANPSGVALAAPAASTATSAGAEVKAGVQGTAAPAGKTPTAGGEPTGDSFRDYAVQRGDTLWDIADNQLDDPYRWPQIAEASADIPQPDGRRLEDPNLILPGWTLHVPRPGGSTAAASSDGESQGESVTGDDQVVPPSTPMHPAGSPTEAPLLDDAVATPPRTPIAQPAESILSRSSGSLRGTSSANASVRPRLPSTPLHTRRAGPDRAPAGGLASADGSELPGVAGTPAGGLPDWITSPLLPLNSGDAEDMLTAVRTLHARSRRSG